MNEEDIKKTFSKRLAYYLEINGKSQADLSKYLGVSSATVSDWCNAKKMPRMNKIQSISNWFHVDNSALLEADVPMCDAKEQQARIAKALELYAKYEKAIPEIQSAVEGLLKSPRSEQ